MKTKDALLKLQSFLTKEKWCFGAYARQANGQAIPIKYPTSDKKELLANRVDNLTFSETPDSNCKFCLVGSMVYLKINTPEVYEALEEAMHKKYKYTTLQDFNDADGTKFEHVAEVIAEAVCRQP